MEKIYIPKKRDTKISASLFPLDMLSGDLFEIFLVHFQTDCIERKENQFLDVKLKAAKNTSPKMPLAKEDTNSIHKGMRTWFLKGIEKGVGGLGPTTRDSGTDYDLETVESQPNPIVPFEMNQQWKQNHEEVITESLDNITSCEERKRICNGEGITKGQLFIVKIHKIIVIEKGIDGKEQCLFGWKRFQSVFVVMAHVF